MKKMNIPIIPVYLEGIGRVLPKEIKNVTGIAKYIWKFLENESVEEIVEKQKLYTILKIDVNYNGSKLKLILLYVNAVKIILMSSFEKFGLRKQHNAIEDLGFKTPTPIQDESFSVILSGKDMLRQLKLEQEKL